MALIEHCPLSVTFRSHSRPVGLGIPLYGGESSGHFSHDNRGTLHSLAWLKTSPEATAVHKLPSQALLPVVLLFTHAKAVIPSFDFEMMLAPHWFRLLGQDIEAYRCDSAPCSSTSPKLVSPVLKMEHVGHYPICDGVSHLAPCSSLVTVSLLQVSFQLSPEKVLPSSRAHHLPWSQLAYPVTNRRGVSLIKVFFHSAVLFSCFLDV